MLNTQEFDECITASQFGKFHLYLVFIAFFSHCANIISVSNAGFISTSAECDLGMSLIDKGTLQGMPYIGMICSGFFAGFLTDTFGRQKTLVFVYGIVSVIYLIETFSQTFMMMACCKFLEGFLINGSYCANVSIVSEFSSIRIRDRMLLLLSSFVSWAQVVLALIGWYTLTRDWNFTLFGGAIVLRNWNFFIAFCGLFSCAGCILYYSFPESPKFLMSRGQNKKAMDVVMKIYTTNTGKPRETHPCGNMTIPDTGSIIKGPLKDQLIASFGDVKLLTHKPYSIYIMLITLMQFMLMVGYITLKAWFPSIIRILENYHTKPAEEQTANNICEILDMYMSEAKKAEKAKDEPCIPLRGGNRVFVFSIVMGLICLVPYILSVLVVDKLGKKRMLYICFGTCSFCSMTLYFTTQMWQVATLFSIFVGMAQVSLSFCQQITVSLFPTTVRTLAIALGMMIGRLGSISGNIMFPVLLAQGCMIPFMTIAIMMIDTSSQMVLNPNDITKQALDCNPQGKRKRGRPKEIW